MLRSPWARVGIVLLVVGVIWVALRATDIDLSGYSPERIRDFIQSFGVWAPLVYIGAYAQPIVPLPATVMTTASGLAFPPAIAAVSAITGASLRAYAQFLISRFFGRSAAERLLKGRAETLDRKLGDNAFHSVLFIRLIPNLPYDVQNYGFGLSRIRFTPYAVATTLGILPGSLAFVYLGHSLSEPQHLWKLGAAVAVIVLLVFLQKKFKRKTPNASDV